MRIDTTGDGDPSVTVGALYSSGACITSAGNVGVSSCHGRITVDTAGTSGVVNLSSVNGTAQVSTGEGLPKPETIRSLSTLCRLACGWVGTASVATSLYSVGMHPTLNLTRSKG